MKNFISIYHISLQL